MRTTTALAALTAALALAGVTACGSSPKAAQAAAKAPGAPAAHSYADVQSLLAAMAQHGAACSDVTLYNTVESANPGALSPYADCSGISSGDTAIVMYKDHASAVVAANDNTGLASGYQAAVVVGPNWTVNTVPAFAHKVVKAVGGQLILITGGPGPSAASSASSAPQPSAPAAPTMTRQTDTVVFKVSGSGYPSIQYGSDSNSNSPPGGYGPLGDGNALPWSASLTYDSGALYYAVSAQLQGYGDISDSVTEVITTYCSDGSHKTERFPLASGHASGGYNIAQAEYAGGDTGNAQQAESDAGC